MSFSKAATSGKQQAPSNKKENNCCYFSPDFKFNHAFNLSPKSLSYHYLQRVWFCLPFVASTFRIRRRVVTANSVDDFLRVFFPRPALHAGCHIYSPGTLVIMGEAMHKKYLLERLPLAHHFGVYLRSLDQFINW